MRALLCLCTSGLVVAACSQERTSPRGGPASDKPAGSAGEGEGEDAGGGGPGDGGGGAQAGEEGEEDGEGGAVEGEGEGDGGTEEGEGDGGAEEGEGDGGAEEGEGEEGEGDEGEGEEGEGEEGEGEEGEGEEGEGDDGKVEVCGHRVAPPEEGVCGWAEVSALVEALWDEASKCEAGDVCVEVDLSLGWCDCGPKAARQGADVEIIRCLRAAWANDYAQGGCPMPACAAPSPEMCRGVAACDAAAGRCVVLREGDGAPDPM